MTRVKLILSGTLFLSALAQPMSAHDLIARAVDENTIEVSGSISLANGCISFVGMETTRPSGAPTLSNTATVVSRLSHSGFAACTLAIKTVPVEVTVPRPARHPADKRPEFLVHYTIVDGAPDGAILEGDLLGEVIALED